MATLATGTRIAPGKIGVLRAAVTGALAAPAFFLLCWLGARLAIGPATHLYIQLFTNAEPTSAAALFQGTCWSLAFGLVAGALIAFFYNLLASLDGRKI